MALILHITIYLTSELIPFLNGVRSWMHCPFANRTNRETGVNMKNAQVYLIGAGPGSLELLTLGAVRAIGLADAILIDDLVNPDVLEFARSNVQIVHVGKRGGCNSTPQTFIHKQMISLARAGTVVARIKGGDPFMFGRGGEELQALRQAGISVSVISGITSGMAVTAFLTEQISQQLAA